MELTNLAQYGAVGISIALIVFMAWAIKTGLDFAKEQMKNARETHKGLQIAIEQNTKATHKSMQMTGENYKFLKNLNGNLTKILKEKVNQQN